MTPIRKYMEYVRRHIVIGATFVVVACVGDKAVAPSVRAPTSTLATIAVSPMNIVMAVGDTMRVLPTGVTLSGEQLTSFDSVLYVLSNVTDTLRVSVSATGLVTALSPSNPTTPVLVNVVAFKDGVAAADQAVFLVTATKFSGATLSVQPIPASADTLAAGSSAFIIPVIRNPSTGESVSNARIRLSFTKAECQYVACYQPTYPAIATLTSDQLSLDDNGPNRRIPLGYVSALGKPGVVWVRANVMVYGVMLRDSVQYTLTYRLDSEVDIGLRGLAGYNPTLSGVDIARGGEVLFYNNIDRSLGATITIAFDNPEAATAIDPPSTIGGASGNITTMATDEYTQRQFLTPGDYGWTATIAGGVPPYTGATIRGFVHVH